MYSVISRFLNKNKLAKNFSLSFIFVGVLGIVFIDKIIRVYFEYNNINEQGPLAFGILFLLTTGAILYFMINHMQKVLKNMENAYAKLKEKEKDRLAPYEFALDHSVDAIHWFNLEGKFIYVNNATCKLDGYSKEEFNDFYLSEIDINFTKEELPALMHKIKSTQNWTSETIHKKKDGTICQIEVSGHGIIYNGQEYICAFARDITQRKEYREKITKMNEELQKSVAEKEILLKEIHHRVKNNMEIISSLLNMQAYKSDDLLFKEAMKESQSKIHAMALVHEFLYLGETLHSINLNDYINRLIQDIRELYISQNTKLDVDLHIEELEFSINRCIQVGMILHELCVNALKYAFRENRDNLLCIHIKRNNETINMKIRDNGKGLENLTHLEKVDSIGMQLIHSIVDFQLEGTIDFKNNNGLECTIIFPEKEII
jgi:two-component system, sensor histidine kinase PdtaS